MDTGTRAPAQATGNGAADPFAGMDPEVASIARAQEALVREHDRHQAAVGEVLDRLPDPIRPAVEAFQDRRWPARRTGPGRPRGSGTKQPA